MPQVHMQLFSRPPRTTAAAAAAAAAAASPPHATDGVPPGGGACCYVSACTRNCTIPMNNFCSTPHLHYTP
ncbi:unnamed protein product [Sphagnum jensenii]